MIRSKIFHHHMANHLNQPKRGRTSKEAGPTLSSESSELIIHLVLCLVVYAILIRYFKKRGFKYTELELPTIHKQFLSNAIYLARRLKT